MNERTRIIKEIRTMSDDELERVINIVEAVLCRRRVATAMQPLLDEVSDEMGVSPEMRPWLEL